MSPRTSGLTPIGAAIFIWSTWFVFLYGSLSVGCAVAPPSTDAGASNWLNALLAVITVVVFFGFVAAAIPPWRRATRARAPGSASAPESDTRDPWRFLDFVAAGIHGVCAASMPVIALSVLRLPPCV
jgi:hypothetical protein